MADTSTHEPFARQQERMKSLARDTSDAINSAKARAADTLHDVTGAVKETASDVTDAVKETASQVTGGRSVRQLTDSAVDSFSDAADYVKRSDASVMWDDFANLVKSRPVESLAVAAVLGFVLGRTARRG